MKLIFHSYNESSTQTVKQELMDGRGVEVTFCADNSLPGQTAPEKYINTATWAHYTYDIDASVTHAVTIVGWDDTYSKSNFLTGHQPPDDGAWIVKNSWGSKDVEFPHYSKNGWGVDGGGYFYLSYYDMSIDTLESFDFYTENFGQEADYYLINQHDYLPSPGVNSGQSTSFASMANVFEASEDQSVRSLSCETASPGTMVTYKLYLLNNDYSGPEDGTLLTTVSEAYTYGGYHRTQLGEGFPIREGQHYSVVVTQQVGTSYEILTDRGLNKAGKQYVNDQGITYDHHAVGVINEGESFLFEQGAWSDWTEAVAEIKESDVVPSYGSIYDYDNFPIKAYADPIELPKIVTVPNLTNMTETEAIAALKQQSLLASAGAAEYSDTIEAGRVLRQDIEPGAQVEEGQTVTYNLSLGTEPAPERPTPSPVSDDPSDSTGSVGPGSEQLAKAGDTTLPLIQFLIVLSLVCIAAIAVTGSRIWKRRKNKTQ